MNEVRCSGFEKSVTECQFNKEALGCSHEEDAAVRCNVPAMGFQETVSRTGTRTSVSGWVLVLLRSEPPCGSPAAAPERRQDSLRGPGGGSGGAERLAGVGDGVWGRLGDHGGHGGVSPAGSGLRQQLLPGGSSGTRTLAGSSSGFNPPPITFHKLGNKPIFSLISSETLICP